MLSRIPVASVDLSGNEEAYAVDAIRSTWISSTGAYLNRFEREFAEFCHTTTSLTVCNGTVALHLALLGLDVRPGDEVLVPTPSWTSYYEMLELARCVAVPVNAEIGFLFSQSIRLQFGKGVYRW